MAFVLVDVPTDITIPQLSTEEIERFFGPVNLYSLDYYEMWVGTGKFGDGLDFLYEGYGLGKNYGYVTGMTGWQNSDLEFIIDEFKVSTIAFASFTPGDPLSSLGIFMGADEMYGSKGNDVFKSFGGPDYLDGDKGNDTLNGGAGGDDISGGKGNDLLIGARGSDLLRGQSGNDTIKAGSGADTLIGGSGSDVLTGGGGANYIWAGNDNDVDTITVLTDGELLGRVDHSKYDDLYELGANDRIIMDVSGSATLEFTSFGNGEIDIWVNDELEAIVHGLSLGQVEDMTSFG